MDLGEIVKTMFYTVGTCAFLVVTALAARLWKRFR